MTRQKVIIYACKYNLIIIHKYTEYKVYLLDPTSSSRRLTKNKQFKESLTHTHTHIENRENID